jgi:hypothetical protein
MLACWQEVNAGSTTICNENAYKGTMWKKRDIVRVSAVIIGTIVGWGLIRLIFPSLDYYPPESLTSELERSWFVNAGVRKLAMMSYAITALIVMAILFNVVQQRWPGRGSYKGLAFGTSFGVVWFFGFLGGWAFLGTTLRAELLNGVVDPVPLAFGGWLIGLAVGRDVPQTEQQTSTPWLAIPMVAFGFVVVHALGATLLKSVVGPASSLLFVPTNPLQFALLAGLGLWVGGMYVVLRAGLPFKSTWARVAFFAFGVFGFSWTWFHMFLVIIDLAGLLHVGLLAGLPGAVGVFVGALAYEWLARVIPS